MNNKPTIKLPPYLAAAAWLAASPFTSLAQTPPPTKAEDNPYIFLYYCTIEKVRTFGVTVISGEPTEDGLPSLFKWADEGGFDLARTKIDGDLITLTYDHDKGRLVAIWDKTKKAALIMAAGNQGKVKGFDAVCSTLDPKDIKSNPEKPASSPKKK